MSHAHAKVILLGEHAVVYGVPAIAAGIERGARARAAPAETPELVIGERRFDPGDGSELGRALGALLGALGAPAMRVEIDLDVPAGSGLGASAAMAVAAARAVLDVLEPASREDAARRARVLDAARAWESIFHGTPSGIDAAAAALGGCIYFTRADGPTPLALDSPLHLAIALADPPASTRAMVEGVAKLKERRPDMVRRSLDAIEALASNARLCIEAGDVVGLGKLFDLNQMLLAGLFLSTEGIERACRLARDAGALGAKLTGAGGGGAVVALTDADPEPVLAAWRGAGLECFASVVKSHEDHD
jgi:mevalonate kinase